MTAITLRRATVDDAEFVHQCRSEPSTSRYQPVLRLPLEGVRAMLIERSNPEIGPDQSGKYQWIIEADGQPAGWVSVEIDLNGRRHAIGVVGYTIGEQSRKRGYGRTGLALLLPIAFGRTCLNLERLEAVAAVENIASRRVLERNGFRHEGVLRGLLIVGGERVDHAIYGLLRTDWEA